VLTVPQLQAFSQRIVTLAVLLLIAAAVLAASPERAQAGPNEGDFFGATNSARSAAGLPAYVYAGDLAAAARAQAKRMASSGQLAHSPNLGGAVANWQGLAENVGVGTDWLTIQQALMNSPDHRAAILDAGYTQMGVGTAVDRDGTLWVSEVFRLPAGTTASPPSIGSSAAAVQDQTEGTGVTSTSNTPSPAQSLRSKIRDARDKVGAHRRRQGADDPLEAALDYSTVMNTVGS